MGQKRKMFLVTATLIPSVEHKKKQDSRRGSPMISIVFRSIGALAALLMLSGAQGETITTLIRQLIPRGQLSSCPECNGRLP